MEGLSQNSITICLPPSLNLSEINADNLRSVVEAACQNSQNSLSEDGEIILYVRDQQGQQESEQQGFILDQSLLDAEGVIGDGNNAFLFLSIHVFSVY